MSRHAQENIVSALLLAVFAGVILLCLDFGPRARMIPLPLAVFGIVLTVIQLLWHNLRSADELQMDMITVKAPSIADGASTQEAQSRERPTWHREAGAYGIVGGLVVLILVVGVLPAVFLFTWGYFRFSGYCSWLAGLIYTSIITGSVYLLFVVALEMQLYHGLLAPLFQ